MKKTFPLLLATIFMLTSFAGEAQIISGKNIKNRLIKRAGQRAEEKATQKMEDGVDKGVDKVFDSLFGPPAKKTEPKTTANSGNDNSSEEAALGMMNKMMSSFGVSEAPSSNYNFSSSYVMNIQSKTKDEDFKMKTKYYFTESGKYMGTKILEGTHPQMNSSTGGMEAMIMDFEKKSMYTFLNTDGKKVMMGISLNSTLGIAEASSSEAMESKLTKTGETKTIAGYATDAFLLTQGEDKSTIWISRSRVPVVSTYYEAFQKMSSSGNSFLSANTSSNAQMAAFAKEGRAMLGMSSKTKDGDEMNMEVENIQASDPFSFSTSGYENMMDMNKIMPDAMKEGAKD
ncbi:MAG: hypothetical protein ACI9IP_003154 [Arcticibacterium sp.]|jgi:hypothetical protein